ncbi:sigma-54 interaction domain protein [Burkholderia mallei]|nr:sigma-54 interaction domain protein [Burkholderia mallei]
MPDFRPPSDCAPPGHAAQRSASPADAAARQLVYLSRTPDTTLVAHLRARRWNVHVARSANEAARRVKPNQPQAGIADLDGFAPRELPTLEAVLRQQQVGWIALAGDTRINDPDVRRLIRQYCFDYMQGLPPHETIDYLVGHAYGMVALCDLDVTAGAAATGDEMVGACDAMQQLFRTIRKVAATDATVFISGESGTGKELTALAIHERSERRKAPFVAIN